MIPGNDYPRCLSRCPSDVEQGAERGGRDAGEEGEKGHLQAVGTGARPRAREGCESVGGEAESGTDSSLKVRESARMHPRRRSCYDRGDRTFF